MTNSLAIILNAGSGITSALEKLRQLKLALAAQDLNPEIFLAHDGDTLKTAAEKALSQGFTTVVAAGGDGTVSAVAEAVYKAGATLGILPLGTLNHLAKDLNIPEQLDAAVGLLKQGQVKTIDLGEVNGKIFVNNSSIGLYPKIVALRQQHQRRGWSKGSALFWALLYLLRRYSFFEVRVKISGQDTILKSPLVFVGNNKYEVEGANLGSRGNLDNQELIVCVLRHSSRWGLVALAWHALFGGLAKHPDFDVYYVKEAYIGTFKKFLAVAVDGEVVNLQTPLRYKLLPRVLKVIVGNL